VEKGLKALYIEQQGALPPRSHDVEHLGRLVQAPAAIASDLAIVNPAFDAIRYPDPSGFTAPVDIITSAVAAQHLAATERILAWIEPQLA
jgi:HEPN domain-containing protein